jgi:hypothetical protein
MGQGRLARRPRHWLLAGLLLLAAAGVGRAEDSDAELRRLIEQQRQMLEGQKRRLEEMRQQLDHVEKQRSAPAKEDGGDPAPAADAAKDQGAPDPDAVKKITGDYLKDNPGAGMPPSVQTGFFSGQGFVIRSTANPDFVKWDDESRIPFTLSTHLRLQGGYYFYKVTDDTNHQTGAHQQSQDANAHRFADFGQLEMKRANLIFNGTVFDPDLHFQFNLLGQTRGLPGFQNNKVVQTAGAFNPNTSATAAGTGGGVLVDHAVTLFEAYIYYDFHGCASERGCGPDCPEGTYKYAPTYTLIAGKLKPFFGLEEYLGNQNLQFPEFSMSELYFSADDDARLMAAGMQVKAFEDRFFTQMIVYTGTSSFLPNTLADDLPNFIMGFWYDLGGTWNPQKKAWDLFGDCLSDIDYSCNPVVRVGGCVNVVPQDRRSLYGDGEQSRWFVMPSAPNGVRLINLLNGDGSSAAAALKGAHAVDAFDAFEYSPFVALKYRGFSLSDEFWVRNLNDFKAPPNGFDQIWYTYVDPRTKATVTALFPNKTLVDFGNQLQGGYFVVPHKLELVARWSFISGDSGDVLGNTNLPPTVFSAPNGVAGKAGAGLTRVQINPGAFSNYHLASEYDFGVNYFFRRHNLKWQTDFTLYQGGNPVGATGQSVGCFIPGLDGYGIRTQFQLLF